MRDAAWLLGRVYSLAGVDAQRTPSRVLYPVTEGFVTSFPARHFPRVALMNFKPLK
jgi:hypothetical protein